MINTQELMINTQELMINTQELVVNTQELVVSAQELMVHARELIIDARALVQASTRVPGNNSCSSSAGSRGVASVQAAGGWHQESGWQQCRQQGGSSAGNSNGAR